MAWFSPSQSFAEGWGAPPQLSAPNIGGLVGEILQDRLLREKMQRAQMADTIKNIQEQRQKDAYLEAAQEAGVLPEGDYGALGVKGASTLAEQIRRKQEADARAAHLKAMEARLSARGGGRGGGGGAGGGGGDQTYPETIWDDQGREWRKGPGGRLIPMTPPRGAGTSGGAAGPKPQTQDQIMREQARLLEEKDVMDQEIAQQQHANIDKKLANVPYTRSGEYNRTVNRLKQLQQIPGMPTTDVPGATLPADQAGGHAVGYGTDATSMSADDIRAAYKAGKMTQEEATARLKAIGFSD